MESRPVVEASPRYALVIRTYRRRLGLSVIMLVLVTMIALLAGRYPKAGFSNPFALLDDAVFAQVVYNVRLPRILLAITGGASLAAAGFVFQMLFANPLVEPGFLGVSQGAAFGAALAIAGFGFSALLVQVSATIFGLLALVASYWLAKQFRFGGWILRLILSGIAIGAVYSAGLSIIKLVADPTTSLQDITFWMMGGLWNSTWKSAWSVMPVMWIALLILVALRWRINLLSLDERTAHTIGIAVSREKSLMLFVATVATTAIISVAGLVGWVGLIVPHIARRLLGSDARFALPGSMVMGALFLLSCDTIGRTLLSSEIPLGVLTSLIGAILFVVILSRKQTEVRL
ncbi:FecCD family ABC transporter permease [Pleomorphochaeta sp. DL1XJH-081]|uniref:FecCD family ABC transporter permease n=1 Tax=Pleomorphochaeta sp. DL1XJH-081 TaxID=3409690 RepID=UPI003BB4E84B